MLPLRKSDADDSSSSQFSDSSDEDDNEPIIKKADARLQNSAPSRALSQYHGLVSEGSLHAHRTGMCMIEQQCRVPLVSSNVPGYRLSAYLSLSCGMSTLVSRLHESMIRIFETAVR